MEERKKGKKHFKIRLELFLNRLGSNKCLGTNNLGGQQFRFEL